MVSFRFHLTSLVAVFLSLGLGVLVGVSLSEHGGMRSEQQMLIRSIEASLNQLRADNASLMGENAQLKDRIRLYDDLLLAVGRALLADGLAGSRITLLVPGQRIQEAERLQEFLRSFAADVSLLTWDEPGPATLQIHAAGGRSDAVIFLVDETDVLTAELAEKMTQSGYSGLFAASGTLPERIASSLSETGWGIVPHVDTLPGMLDLAVRILNLSEAKAGRGLD